MNNVAPAMEASVKLRSECRETRVAFQEARFNLRSFIVELHAEKEDAKSSRQNFVSIRVPRSESADQVRSMADANKAAE